MSFMVQSNKSDSKFKLVPVGNHLGRCYRIIDLGTQTSVIKGETSIQKEIEISWEVHGNDDNGNPLTTSDGRPLVIDRRFSRTWYENSALRKMLQSWRNKPWTNKEAEGFDLKNILGHWAMVAVVHRVSGNNGKTYANVNDLTPVPNMIRQAGLPSGFNETKIFDLSNPDWELYESLPEWKQKKIAMSPEYQEARSGKKPQTPSSGFEDMDDDIPF